MVAKISLGAGQDGDRSKGALKKRKKHVPRESMKLSTSIAFLSIFWPKILSINSIF